MQDLFKRFGVAYLSGALGGLAYAVVAWLFSHWAFFKTFSLPMLSSGLTWNYAAPLILKGSLWALLLVPMAAILRVRGAVFGLIISLIPVAYVLLIQYPREHHGLLPWAQSPANALLVLVSFGVWGLVAGSAYISQYK